MTINLNCGSILSHGRAKWTKLKIITKIMMIAETMGFYADTMVKTFYWIISFYSNSMKNLLLLLILSFGGWTNWGLQRFE